MNTLAMCIPKGRINLGPKDTAQGYCNVLAMGLHIGEAQSAHVELPNLKTFKYQGGTDSVTYKLLWSPLAQALLRWTSPRISPNLITLTSLVLVVAVHVLLMYHYFTAKTLQTWHLILFAVTILCYQTMDNLDGKQARRTNTSSPLGMMFDHGVDAISSFLIAFQILAFVRVESPYHWVYATFFFIMLVYFCAMWSQYCTGSFRLGVINPVDEGLPMYALSAIFVSVYPDFFTQKGIWTTRNIELLYVMTFIAILVLFNMITYLCENRVLAIRDILPLLVLPLTYFLGLGSLWWIGLETYYAPLLYVLACSWSRNMIEIQLSHIVKDSFKVFNLSTLVFLMITVLSVGNHVLCSSMLNPAQCQIGCLCHSRITLNDAWWGAVGVQLLILVHFCVNVLLQGAQALNIPILTQPDQLNMAQI